jgi:hypothetical protein
MKKRDLLFAGLLLCTISAFGQTTPPRYADDSKVIFIQNFESASTTFKTKVLNTDPKRPTTLYTWNDQPVDQITQITYYKREGHSNPSGGADIYSGAKEYEVAGIRDTLMELYDGVMRTDAVWPEDSILNYDTHSIEMHTNETQAGLDKFGEKGGNKYFSYSSKEGNGIQNVGSSDYSADNKAVAAYRRNLFVRNIPIEANSSYRVTVFVRPTQLAVSDKATLRFGLDLLRGYFHSEKPFLVEGKKATSSPATFEDKSDYTNLTEGEWNKIVLMSYYNNDSIGDASAYLASYYWQGDWDWTVGRDADGNVVNDLGRGKARNAAGELVNSANAKDTTTLTFIKQPNKYFVRIAFRSDSTKFDVDNLSLHKSWIGGVEHHNDLLRVDFGYETNMGDLAQAALEKNKIAAVELPGEYFEVWARFKNKLTGVYKWQVVPINSAEYHGDGYMYMWTKPWEDDGSMRSFEGADSVLVTFRNPVDRDDLKLLYTGTRYPNGGNVEWQNDKSKRLVYDFHNEMSSLNPNIDYDKNGKRVLSLKDLPPVMQRAPYEDGTFGLSPDIRQMTFKFSRQLVFENTGDDNTDISFIKVVGSTGTEYWEFKAYADENDTNTVIVRPAKYTAPLAGDYVLTIDQITHLDDANPTDADAYGSDVVMNLHFGDFEINPANPITVQSDWRSEITVDGAWDRPTPSSLYVLNGNDGFYQGTGQNFDPYTKTGLYKMVDDGVHGDCFFYLCSYKTKDEVNLGRLFSAHALKAGNYKLSLYAFGWGRNNLTSQVFVYPKPATMTEEALAAARTATANAKIGEIKPTSNISWSGNDTEKTWTGTGTGWGGDGNIKGSDVQFFELEFSVAADGDYVFEWTINNNGSQTYYGISLCNFTVTRLGNLSLAPVRSVIDALDAANAQIAKANAAVKYKGAAFETLNALATSEASFVATKKASGVNAPSDYKAESELIMKAVNAQKSRVGLIDDFFKTLDDAQAKTDYCDTAAAFAEFRTIPDIAALKALKASYDTYNYAAANDAAITAEQNKVKAAIAGIDLRVALGKVWPDAITYAKAMKDTAVAHSLAVTALSSAITAAETFDDDHATYAELRAQMTALTDLAFETVYKDTIDKISVRRIKELDALATTVGATYPEGVAARVAAAQSDDDELAEIIKCAIKVAIYDKIVKGEAVENINLTPFIKNYYLYATVKGIVDNSDLELPGSRNEARAQALQGAAQIQKIGHQWGQDALGKKCWVMVLNQEYTDLYPGWSAQSFVTSNHSMVTPDLGYGNLKNDTLVNQGMVLDGKVAMDWNSKAELKQTIAGLPAGVYSLGAEIGGDGINSANLTVVTDVQTYTKDIKSDKKMGDILVLEQKMDIDYVIESGSGSPNTDNFSLTYVGKNEDPFFQQYWQQLLDNAKSELDNLVTIVDKAKVAKAGVEYYTISGIKLDAPKAGQILIRKTTNANGKVVVDKVLIK